MFFPLILEIFAEMILVNQRLSALLAGRAYHKFHIIDEPAEKFLHRGFSPVNRNDQKVKGFSH
jgi:hypothetical protein